MTTPTKDWQATAEEAILDYFRPPWDGEPFHSDDLWHVIPDAHRGVISLAVMALVNKKLIVGCGYRKSAIPSRKRSPSQEYRLTELGRDRIVGVSAGAPKPQGPGGAFVSPCHTSADSGEQSARPDTGAPSSQEEARDPISVPSTGEGEDRAGAGRPREGNDSGPVSPEPLTLLPEPDPEVWAA